YNVALGQRLPAHSTSPGRLLLSGLDDAEIDRRLNMPSLSNVKPMITLSLDQLKTEISKIRAQGWAMTDQTMSLGYRAAAAPVYDATGMMVAAIGIVVHGSEISHENLANSVLPQLVDAASRITDDFVTMSKLPRRRVAPVEAGYVNFAAGATTSA
ncbi:MAG: IclR family transcriptional regulator domain-containing protein, partial [Ilumatobacteraceae bacterium]